MCLLGLELRGTEIKLSLYLGASPQCTDMGTQTWAHLCVYMLTHAVSQAHVDTHSHTLFSSITMEVKGMCANKIKDCKSVYNEIHRKPKLYVCLKRLV